ncbi:MAG TPA: hypothetical protein VMV59_04950, partial [Candidatus Dormibacteraeota bacterium]|nr:hypothetical protein [Candidatus Dormibacteraeota bacterium]
AKLARSLTRLLRENHDLHYSRLLTDLSALRADAESPLERAPTLATEDVFCLNFIRTVKNATGNPQYELVSIPLRTSYDSKNSGHVTERFSRASIRGDSFSLKLQKTVPDNLRASSYYSPHHASSTKDSRESNASRSGFECP